MFNSVAAYQQVLRTIQYNNTVLSRPAIARAISIVASDGELTSMPATLTINLTSMVTGRELFYNNSKFDHNTPGISTSDDGAIAPDKTAYLPGEGTATPANVSSYTKGINGIDVDL